MKRFLILFLALVGTWAASGAEKIDTLKVSHKYTTHLIFASDLIYADCSNRGVVASKIVDENKNMFAMMARGPFNTLCSVSLLESSGAMHTFVVKYDENPNVLVYDFRKLAAKEDSGVHVSSAAQLIADAKKKEGKEVDAPARSGSSAAAGKGGNVSSWKRGTAPALADLIKEPQRIYHVACTEYDIQALCEDISSYSDITYFLLSVRNDSGISYELSSATFVIESKSNNRKRTVQMTKTLQPRIMHGKLSAAPGEYTRAVYSFDKVTLSKNQVLKIYMYEERGQRNLVLTLSAADVNKARSTIS